MTDLEDDLHVAIYHYLTHMSPEARGLPSIEDKWPKEISLYKYSRLCNHDKNPSNEDSILYVKAQEKPILEASTLNELKLKAIVAFGVDKIFKTEYMVRIALGDSLTRRHVAELKLA